MNKLLIDIGPLSCGCSNGALEYLHKAMQDDGNDIFRPHENIFIRKLVEQMSDKGTDALAHFQEELNRWLGATATGTPTERPKVGKFVKWTESEMTAVRLYFSALPKSQWTMADYSLLIDYLVQRYFPDDPSHMADYFVKRAMLAGKMQAEAESVSEEQAEAFLEQFRQEKELERIERIAKLNEAVLDYGTERCADMIQAVTETTRHKIKNIILDHQKTLMLEVPKPSRQQAASGEKEAEPPLASIEANGKQAQQQAALDEELPSAALAPTEAKVSKPEQQQAASSGKQGESSMASIDAIEKQPSEQPKGTAQPSLQTKLFDAFGQLNRDWRRIAITEIGENANQGMIASMQPGDKVKRVEQYAGACPFCKKWNGKILTVVDPSKPDKNWDTEVWIGKTNVGRSVSPYKRTELGLVKRTDSELCKPAAGLFHPHCRGMWVRVGGDRVGDDFGQWLDGFLAKIDEQEKKRKESMA